MCSTPNTPSGTPPARNASAMASAQRGTVVACLSSAVLPTIRVGARKRNTCQMGKFHGITANTQPIGS